ncbi:hypothetical protein GCM10010172_61160 [Paractinoplanes ferrugineus]|uniref:Uncharacterized protein n=1 Tax=Paractinoplanes ferrugineus TaxID=113564 RepID=A0A919JCC1_9ACTN|nr:hypothetical protein Afe05nite_63960 [Actinoplanes ferrugineus]
MPVAESSAKRSGKWSSRSGGSCLGGKALVAGAKNAKLTWTFTGRSAALWVRSLAPGRHTVAVVAPGSNVVSDGLFYIP